MNHRGWSRLSYRDRWRQYTQQDGAQPSEDSVCSDPFYNNNTLKNTLRYTEKDQLLQTSFRLDEIAHTPQLHTISSFLPI